MREFEHIPGLDSTNLHAAQSCLWYLDSSIIAIHFCLELKTRTSPNSSVSRIDWPIKFTTDFKICLLTGKTLCENKRFICTPLLATPLPLIEIAKGYHSVCSQGKDQRRCISLLSPFPIEQPPAICLFGCPSGKPSGNVWKHITLIFSFPPWTPARLMARWCLALCYKDFAVGHRVGCRITEPGLTGDLRPIEVSLIHWLMACPINNQAHYFSRHCIKVWMYWCLPERTIYAQKSGAHSSYKTHPSNLIATAPTQTDALRRRCGNPTVLLPRKLTELSHHTLESQDSCTGNCIHCTLLQSKPNLKNCCKAYNLKLPQPFINEEYKFLLNQVWTGLISIMGVTAVSRYISINLCIKENTFMTLNVNIYRNVAVKCK